MTEAKSSNRESGPDTIIISPIGELPPWISLLLEEKLADFFKFKTCVASLVSDIEFAHDPDRNQYHSTPILKELENRCPDQGLKVVAVTREDLFIPVLTHVYGEAQLGGRACIVSIARLIKGQKDMGADRMVKEAIHELGHCFDLRHCEDAHCIMHYCRKLDDVDKKSSRFCRYCNIYLSDSIRDMGVAPNLLP